MVTIEQILVSNLFEYSVLCVLTFLFHEKSKIESHKNGYSTYVCIHQSQPYRAAGYRKNCFLAWHIKRIKIYRAASLKERQYKL